MHLTCGVVGVVRVRHSFKSGVHERRWPTQAQLTRSDILQNIDVLGRECLWSLVPLSPNRSDMHLTSGVVSVAHVRYSFKSGVHEWRWPTQAQLMRSDILRNINVLSRECLSSLVPLSPRGR